MNKTLALLASILIGICAIYGDTVYYETDFLWCLSVGRAGAGFPMNAGHNYVNPINLNFGIMNRYVGCSANIDYYPRQDYVSNISVKAFFVPLFFISDYRDKNLIGKVFPLFENILGFYSDPFLNILRPVYFLYIFGEPGLIIQDNSRIGYVDFGIAFNLGSIYDFSAGYHVSLNRSFHSSGFFAKMSAPFFGIIGEPDKLYGVGILPGWNPFGLRKYSGATETGKKTDTMQADTARDTGLSAGKTPLLGISEQPPVIVISYPKEDGLEVSVEKIKLEGVVVDDKGIEEVEVRVGGKAIKTRGVKVEGKTSAEVRKRVIIEEEIFLNYGDNEITVMAKDSSSLVSENKIKIIRKKGEPGNIWGVVIGLSDYKDDKIRDLKYAEKDAKDFEKYLKEDLGVPGENIKLYINDKAGKAEILNGLGEWAKAKAGKNDAVIIFFAGHGATEDDPANEDGDGLSKYLLAHDSDMDKLYSTAIRMEEIQTIFNRIASDKVVFICDSCYSGQAGGRTIVSSLHRGSISDKFLEKLASGKGRVIISACGAKELAKESEELQNGIFTHYLIKGLRGGTADYDKDGFTTTDEIYIYLCRVIPEQTKQTQNPVKKGESEGGIILGVTK